MVIGPPNINIDRVKTSLIRVCCKSLGVIPLSEVSSQLSISKQVLLCCYIDKIIQ